MKKKNDAFNGFFPKDVVSRTEKYLYLKMYWSSIWSHVSTPFSIITNLAGLLTFLKIFGIFKPYIVFITGTILFGMFIWLGMLLIKKNIWQREVEIQARFNPPIQRLLQNTKNGHTKK